MNFTFVSALLRVLCVSAFCPVGNNAPGKFLTAHSLHRNLVAGAVFVKLASDAGTSRP